ncbi:FMN-dependent NADH-azoreductase [Mucilaginibacter sp. L196]|uniref:FMN-dependent NADH-azoreductase n=1 Tax=Mucilaginibacter sp. L196 TaxID=1641870 RepID=UPI00131B8B5B|nr:NAD(P)H-dependent oxidoreductase [Mucilaginibacter sp. L196]
MKILHIISSPKGEASFSIKLGNAIIEKLKTKYPNSIVKEHDLTNTPFPHLEELHLNAFYSPAETHTPEMTEAIKHSDTSIAELKDADIIVIGVPFYNFSIPSTLKAWIDHISRAGVTFTHDENGLHGLITDKKVYLAFASGGVYSEGPTASYDFATPYLKSFLGALGMTDLTVYRVEGVAVPALKDAALEKGIESVEV